MAAWVFASAALLVGVLLVWSGHRMLLRRGRVRVPRTRPRVTGS